MDHDLSLIRYQLKHYVDILKSHAFEAITAIDTVTKLTQHILVFRCADGAIAYSYNVSVAQLNNSDVTIEYIEHVVECDHCAGMQSVMMKHKELAHLLLDSQ